MCAALVPVILAGGVGSRLWPLSRESYPKQFLSLVESDSSLFQATLSRLGGMDTASPVLVCSELHRFLVAEQVRALNISDASIILEPVAKNTAPAVALAALEALSKHADPMMLVLPADHLVQSREAFHRAIKVAVQQAQQGRLATFGVTPTAPQTGYGYVRRGEQLEEPQRENACYRVAEFVEKPDAATAQKYLDSGDYYWNSGMFVFSAKTYIAELRQHAPDILGRCEQAYATVERDLDFHRIDQAVFETCRSESIDYAVMEKTDNAVVVPLDTEWNDVGAWEAIAEVSDRDDSGNAIKGDVLLEQVEGSYIRAESRLVAAIGLKDVVVIETPDAVLVADKQQAQKVKNIVQRLNSASRTEAAEHTRVYRPWGSYESLVVAERFQAKRIIVNPGASLSLQLHHHRAEHWILVKGRGRVTRGEEVFELTEDQSTYIPLGEKHRLENPGLIPLEIIEVQTGSYLGEDDIVRFDDVYGR